MLLHFFMYVCSHQQRMLLNLKQIEPCFVHPATIYLYQVCLWYVLVMMGDSCMTYHRSLLHIQVVFNFLVLTTVLLETFLCVFPVTRARVSLYNKVKLVVLRCVHVQLSKMVYQFLLPLIIYEQTTHCSRSPAALSIVGLLSSFSKLMVVKWYLVTVPPPTPLFLVSFIEI